MRLLLFLLSCGLVSVLSAQQTYGVLQHDAARAAPGYTLLAPVGSAGVYLIDNCGRVVHEWQTGGPAGLETLLLPNGNLLRTARRGPNFPVGGSGGGLDLYSWNGELLWSYELSAAGAYQAHHDIEVLPNGNLLVLLWEFKTKAAAGAAGRDTSQLGSLGFWSEMLWELRPTGLQEAEIVWEWHAWDHRVQELDPGKPAYGKVADHPRRIDLNYVDDFEWLHLNSVEYDAAHDQIWLSSRNFNEIWVIDHSTTTAEAASAQGGQSGLGGRLLGRWGNPAAYQRGAAADQLLSSQHTPYRISGSDTILVFNNFALPTSAYSEVVELIIPGSVAPYPLGPDSTFATEAVRSIYADTTLLAEVMSGARRLPNGHTLVTYSDRGRIREVDPAGTTVWDYQVPLRQGIPLAFDSELNWRETVFRADRYAPGYPAFAGRDLAPGDPLEVYADPQFFDCQLTSDTDLSLPGLHVAVAPLPFRDRLRLTLPAPGLALSVYDALGRRQYTQTAILTTELVLTTTSWPPGWYVLRVTDPATGRAATHKLIKK
jgi:hypothetical protein